MRRLRWQLALLLEGVEMGLRAIPTRVVSLSGWLGWRGKAGRKQAATCRADQWTAQAPERLLAETHHGYSGCAGGHIPVT